MVKENISNTVKNFKIVHDCFAVIWLRTFKAEYGFKVISQITTHSKDNVEETIRLANDVMAGNIPFPYFEEKTQNRSGIGL